MIDNAICKLISYALQTGLIQPCEKYWAINTVLDVLKLDSYTDPDQDWGEVELAPVLDELLDDAYARGVLTENSVVYQDLFDTEIMGRLTPRPAQVIEQFQALYAEAPKIATDWYYKFSQDTNYIRRNRIAKDIQWKTPTEYGELDVTINLSKPEKDPICPYPSDDCAAVSAFESGSTRPAAKFHQQAAVRAHHTAYLLRCYNA